MSQHKKLIAALLLAVIFGLCLHPYSHILWLQKLNTNFFQPIGQIFLRLIFMVVVPLIFSALVIAAYELKQSQGLGKIAIKTLAYTLMVSMISVIIGIGIVNILAPGKSFIIDEHLQNHISVNANGVALVNEHVAKTKSVSQSIIELIPKNPIDSAARALDGEMIPLMLFALIFGIALSLTSTEQKQNIILNIFEHIFNACMWIIRLTMVIAPFGIFVLVFNNIFLAGINILISLFLYVATVIVGLLIQQFVVYSFLLKYIAKRSPWQFFKACRECFLYAFSTSSSNATLPIALETAEHKLGIPGYISRFVLTIGSSANQNGTAIFEGVTVLFLAQVYGVDLSLGQQINVVLFSVLAGIGTAGVPGGSLPLIMILLQSVGVPAEGIGLVLGVDRFLDMCRTIVNVSGDIVIATLVVPKEEKVLEKVLA